MSVIFPWRSRVFQPRVPFAENSVCDKSLKVEQPEFYELKCNCPVVICREWRSTEIPVQSHNKPSFPRPLTVLPAPFLPSFPRKRESRTVLPYNAAVLASNPFSAHPELPLSAHPELVAGWPAARNRHSRVSGNPERYCLIMPQSWQATPFPLILNCPFPLILNLLQDGRRPATVIPA